MFIVSKKLLTLFLCMAAAQVVAHTYFFSITELTINTNNQYLEVIHQLTAHDLENAIAENNNMQFSPEHSQYESYIKAYVEHHFSLVKNQQNIPLNWIGLEHKKGKIFIYQESKNVNFLKRIVVKNNLLIDTYPKQVNTVVYQDSASKGSLSFTGSIRIIEIE